MALPLTGDEKRVLRALRESGGMTVSEVAATLEIDIADAAMILAKLARRGLVVVRNFYEATDVDP